MQIKHGCLKYTLQSKVTHIHKTGGSGQVGEVNTQIRAEKRASERALDHRVRLQQAQTPLQERERERVSKQIIFCEERFLAFKRLSPDYFPLAAKQTKTSQQSVMCISPGKFTRLLEMRGWRAHSLEIFNGALAAGRAFGKVRSCCSLVFGRGETRSTASTFCFLLSVCGVMLVPHDTIRIQPEPCLLMQCLRCRVSLIAVLCQALGFVIREAA
jgi:hypothetical protein